MDDGGQVMAKAHFAFGKVSWKRLSNNDFF
jgi:hypothetical protein